MQIPLLTVLTMILILVSASAEPTSLRGGSMNHVGENGNDGGDCSDESCGSTISYGEAYHIQLVSSYVRRWLTGSRTSKGNNGRPRTGRGDHVWTEDGADNGGNAGHYKINPNQYRWIIGSDESDGSRFDDDGQAIWEDPKRNECMRYGDIIYLQGAGQDNHWLTGNRGQINQDVYMIQTSGEAGKWLLRSAAVRDQNDPDPRVGQCVRSKDQVYFQSSEVYDRYLSGGRNKYNLDVKTIGSNQASQFELQSLVDPAGPTLKPTSLTKSPVGPISQPSVSPSSQPTLTPSESPSSKPSDSPSSNEDTIDSLRATIADLAATVISLEESIVQKDSIIADLSFQLDANCVPIDSTPSPTPPTVTPSIAPTKAPTSAPSLRRTNLPTLVSHKLLSLSSSSGVNKYEREGWSRILASDPIRESLDINPTISVMFDWKDQGRGNRKGKVRVLLLSNDGTIVAQKTYQYAPQNWGTRAEIMNVEHDLVNLARVGHSYAVEVMAGWGGGHVLYLRDFELETNFASV